MYGGFDEVRDSSWCLQSGINVVWSMEMCALGSSSGRGVAERRLKDIIIIIIIIVHYHNL